MFSKDMEINYIGSGAIGGKAAGLVFISDILKKEFNRDEFPDIQVTIPTLATIRTDAFDHFMQENNLYEIAFSDLPDDRIANAFQRADLPFEILMDLRRLVTEVTAPLAVRSSSLLEDSTRQPFAGVYATKMTPNNQPDVDTRFRRLVEAIKFVYASTYFRAAKDYMKATGNDPTVEKMAVTIQEVLGKKHNHRFYPDLSGVARSYNFYPLGKARPEDGVISLALGLGKTIVEGEICWSYSPAYPKVDPPYRSVEELLKNTQTKFWAINMGEPPEYNPILETEFLVYADITDAEKDGTLRYLASTYIPHSQRMTIGIGNPGVRVLTFAPLLVLEEFPLNELAKKILKISEEAMHCPVEIEFAMTFNPTIFGYLQVRPMVVQTEEVELNEEDLTKDQVLIASRSVLGNGHLSHIRDIVFIKPENFEARHSRQIAQELTAINRELQEESLPYLLIVIGRLGTTDPWLGIPVNWGQIANAKVIVEATKENFNVVLSQGSHFFHNLISQGVCYFTVSHRDRPPINWEWFRQQPCVNETPFICHVRTEKPLNILINGRKRLGVVFRP